MLDLNYRDSRPIYEQIMDNFRKQIVGGVMIVDEKLPSVRDLAVNMAINPNTIQRAYRELERQGYIYSIPGKGSFVAPNNFTDVKRKKELLSKLEDVFKELLYFGSSKEDLINKLSNISEEKK